MLDAGFKGAMKVTKRVDAEIIVWRVGQVVKADAVDGGVYAYGAICAAWNSVFRSAAEVLSELTRRIVTTSLGFLSIHILIAASQSLTLPASNSPQSV